jgi:NAD(P)-dependent dehydrogenase (short-subunit alcohol dehydrogenase family)
MAKRAALVTGASSGIGLAIARMLGEEGHSVTMVARRAEKLEAAARGLADEGLDVHAVAAQLGEESEVVRAVAEHRERYGRLDVLVNNAGVGVGSPVGEITAKALALQLNLNVGATIFFYRECLEMLRAAAAEHGRALVVNTSSITAKAGQPWLSVYSATKGAVVTFTQSMHRELSGEGIHSTALCPAYVDTPMSEFVQGAIPGEQMIRSEDVAEGVRMLLRLSPACVVPEIEFLRVGDVQV